jgi:hypothetical protein
VIKRAWMWYDDSYTNPRFVETLMELEDGSLIGLTYAGNLVLDGQNFVDERVKYELEEMRQVAEDEGIKAWMRVL